MIFRPDEAQKESDETEAAEAATSKAKAVEEHHDAVGPDMCEDDPSLQKLGHFFCENCLPARAAAKLNRATFGPTRM
jgi:hypothetical protein